MPEVLKQITELIAMFDQSSTPFIRPPSPPSFGHVRDSESLCDPR